MAAKKKKTIYDKPLRDINKDGKKNFKDTWLGDLIGADGKLGVQGPGMKASMKGARRGKEYSGRGNGEAEVAKRKADEKSKAKTDKVYSGRGNGASEVAKRKADAENTKLDRGTPNKKKTRAGKGPTKKSESAMSALRKKRWVENYMKKNDTTRSKALIAWKAEEARRSSNRSSAIKTAARAAQSAIPSVGLSVQALNALKKGLPKIKGTSRRTQETMANQKASHSKGGVVRVNAGASVKPTQKGSKKYG